MTSLSYRARVSAIRVLRNQSIYFAPVYPALTLWNGYGWNPFFPGGGFLADPFSFEFFSGTGCFGFSPFDNLTFDPYGAGVALPPSDNSFLVSDLSCATQFLPAVFGPFCSLCNTEWFSPFAVGPFAVGLNSGFSGPFSPAPQSPMPAPEAKSLPIGNTTGGSAQSSSSNAQAGSASSSSGDSSSAARNDSAFATSGPAPAQPVKLILTSGSAIRATECWLGNKGNLHYVTASGVKMTVPLQQFDMSATMAANRRKGVQLLEPPRLRPLRTPKQQ